MANATPHPFVTAPLVPTPHLRWAQAVNVVRNYTYKIETPNGHGSGFLLTRRPNGVCGIATANHVVERSNTWREMLRIIDATGRIALVNANERVIYADPNRDVAVILFQPPADFTIPATELPLIPTGNWAFPGVEVGWVGYPAVNPNSLCFFRGSVSCILETHFAYLIDGVSIHGLSGGPSFICDQNGGSVHLAGVVSAYLPNYTTGQPLPGVCRVQNVEPFHSMLQTFTSLEQPPPPPPPAVAPNQTPTLAPQ